MADDQNVRPTSPPQGGDGTEVLVSTPRTATPVPSTSTANNSEVTTPVLEARSKRSAESRRSIAYNHLKGGYRRSIDKAYLHSLTKMEIKVSLDIVAAEWGKFLEPHYELTELAATKDAELVNLEFFNKVAALYAGTRELLEQRLEYLDSHPDEAYGKNIHFNAKGEITHTSPTPPHASTMEKPNDHEHHDHPLPTEPIRMGEENLNDQTPKRPRGRELIPSAPRKSSSIPITYDDSNDDVIEIIPGSDPKQSLNATFNLKLEPIKIPMFNGERENWVLFRDQFLALVHNNVHMNDAIRMHQLFTHLNEKAIRVIKGITPAGSNYVRAWNILNERFNNNQMLINHHLGRFFKLPTLTKDEPSKLTILVDGVNELVNSLPGLDEPMKNWDAILIFCMFNKLDRASQEAWKRHLKIHEKPTLRELIEFLDQRAQNDDTVHSSLLNSNPKVEPKKFQKRSVFHVAEKKERNCKLCKEQHPLFRCMTFKNLPVKERWLKAREAKVCLKCLGNHNMNEECKFNTCPVCGNKHNRLLCHEDEKKRNEKAAATDSSIETQIKQANVNHVYLNDDHTTILGTAEIRVHNTSNECYELRCLCDSGSQLNLITEDAVRRFGLTKSKARIQLNGVGGKLSDNSNGIVKIRFGPHFDRNKTQEALFFVVRRISNPLPHAFIKADWLDEEIVDELADPYFNKPGRVDALLGVNVWANIIRPEINRFTDSILAQNTKLGWVVFGSTPSHYGLPTRRRAYLSAVLTENPIDDVLDVLVKFWESEEVPIKKKFRTDAEKKCEEIFVSSHYRTITGRYGVRLPFNDQINELGRSKEIAKRQFLSLERRLEQKPEVKKQYVDFMKEYLQLGHMTITEENESGYYTPHHCVFTSKKFRTVFNASCPTSNGISLNQVQLVGEKLQDDLALLLMRFRYNRIAITADIKKMYRQIEVHPDDRRYQKIFWRDSPNEELLSYELNTITYGQAAAPHCAVRALQQCAIDHDKEYPLASKHVLTCFYMDDYLGGGDTEEKAKEIKYQLECLMQKGGFELSKWCSNSLELGNLDEDKLKNGIPCSERDTTSVLGLHWSPTKDEFVFKLLPIEPQSIWTKRQILSEIGKLYDPNGFVAPFIMAAKLIVQRIWKFHGEWDEPVPPEINEQWNAVIQAIPRLNEIQIPRWLGTSPNYTPELHGFCDASQDAYSAVIYIRTPIFSDSGATSYHCQMVKAKTRVAPCSKPITIPRMELNGAVLLANLMQYVREAFQDQIGSSYYWCDSQIVLRWLRKHPSQLKTYVANRISDIQDISEVDNWYYVPTAENPSDLATRHYDLFFDKSQFWFNGPDFLKTNTAWPLWEMKKPENLELAKCEEKESQRDSSSSDEYVSGNESEENIPQASVNLLTVDEPFKRTVLFNQTPSRTSIIDAYSSFDKIVNVIAWVKRASSSFRRDHSHAPERSLSPNERDVALTIALSWEQRRYMANVIKSLEKNDPNLRDRQYRNLTLFFDSDRLIRLNGRVRNRELDYNFRHPILLPYESTLTKRLLEKAHTRTMHGGAQQMLQYVREKFWIPRARQLAKEVIHACVICKRFAFIKSEQQMAPLPLNRTTPGKVFETCGIDYCGPVYLKPRPGRTPITLKAYICVFICLATRAIHLELVSDLTTNGFLAALRRVVARRGRIKEIISDHGSNFVGAYNVIERIKEHLQTLSEYPFASEFNLKWKFTTERASHHGGIFEAAVKSAKKHLIRVIGEQRLTFEEYGTVLAQVEACLNSRPLGKMSDDPNDFKTLTPGHFIIGEPIILFPDADNYVGTPMNRLNRWELLQRITQDFWKRWNDEYLHSLLHRPKWNRVFKNFEYNDLVIIKEDNIPPARWKLGRIVETLPGPDGLVRSVVLKTATGKLRRPIVKLAFLESHQEDDPNNPEHVDDSSDDLNASNHDSLDNLDVASFSNDS